jgi:hypothetical protein
MAEIDWTAVEAEIASTGMPLQPGAYARWHNRFSAAALLEDQWAIPCITPVPVPARAARPQEPWTDPASFSTTQIRVPVGLQPTLLAVPLYFQMGATDSALLSTILSALSLTFYHLLPTYGACPPGYGPDQVFVGSFDAPDQPGTVRMTVPRWCFWLLATITRLVVFHWQSGIGTAARRDVANIYLQLRAARRFRAFNLPDDPPGMTYGVPRPDGTWFLPNAAFDGSAGAEPGVII